MKEGLFWTLVSMRMNGLSGAAAIAMSMIELSVRRGLHVGNDSFISRVVADRIVASLVGTGYALAKSIMWLESYDH